MAPDPKALSPDAGPRELSSNEGPTRMRSCVSTLENYNKNNNIYTTNNTFFNINTFNYNKNNIIYSTNNTIFNINTFNYNKNNSIFNINTFNYNKIIIFISQILIIIIIFNFIL